MKRFYALVAASFMVVAMMAQHEKLSPALGLLLQQQKEQAASRRSNPHQSTTIKVLAKLAEGADETALSAQYGFRVEGRVGRVLIISMPLSQVEQMAADERVVRIEAERSPRPMLDQVPGQIGADRAWAGTAQQLPQAFTGKGVVVGIVDGGFDYVNPFFRDADGKTRIRWAADYLTDQKYTTTEAVTAAMHSSDAATMLHGTHVAGIAAGSRVNDINDVFYQGIAYEADIAEGAVNSAISTDGTGLSSASSLQAFNDIFTYAAEQGKPCVINFSMGDAMSFAHNRQLEEEGIRTLLAEPGRVLVVSTGNAGGTSRLAYKEAGTAEAGAGIWFNDDEQYGEFFGIELKVKPEQTVRLRLTDSSYKTVKGEAEYTASQLEELTTIALGMKRITVYLRAKDEDGYDVFYLSAGLTQFATSERILATVKGEGEAWIYADPLCAQLENVPAYDHHSIAQEGYSMTWPAEMDEVIAVGNIAHRLKIVTIANKYASQGGVVTPTDLTPYESTKGEGYLARSSSVGPTLTGGLKPDVCAPGVNIVSAYNNFVNENTDMAYAGWLMGILDTEYEPEYGGYFTTLAQTGTSMSAPAVAGTIALWLQADPTLTTARVRDVIAHSSRQPDAALTYPNNWYGYGEIDAFSGLCYLLGIDRIEGVSRHMPSEAAFTLSGRQLRVSGEIGTATVRVYSVAGQLVAQYALSGAGSAIDLSALSAGVYAVQLSTGCAATTGATLIRLD